MLDRIPFFKLCKLCGNIQIYGRKGSLQIALDTNKCCVACSKKDKTYRTKLSKALTGRKFTAEHIQKITDRAKERFSNVTNNPMYGKHHTDATKLKIRNSNFGKRHTIEQYTKLVDGIRRAAKKPELRKKRSINATGNCNGFYGKHHTANTKDILRKKCVVHNRKFGKLLDKGSTEFFNELNSFGFDFVENWLCKGLGYFADGYDAKRSIWIEYDTKYHKRPSVVISDKVRQNKIIAYFNEIGKPLGQFLRYDVVNNKYKVVFRSWNYWKKIYELNENTSKVV